MSNTRLKLAAMTADDLSEGAAEAVRNAAIRETADPPRGADPNGVPEISDAARALLIMCGCTAQFVINYWRVTRRNETGKLPSGVTLPRGRKYREATGVSANAPFSEWQQVLADFTGEISRDK